MSSIARYSILALVFAVATAVHADVLAPADVVDLRVDPGSSNPDDAELTWNPVTTDVSGNPETVAQYHVYRGDTPDFVPDKSTFSNRIGTPTAASFADPGARVDGIDHYYLVSAVDPSGNEGRTRNSRVVTPPVLSGSWTDTTIELSWTDAAPVGEVAAYRVYYGRESGNYEFVTDVGLATIHSLSGLDLWVNWYIAVTAVDFDGNESPFSNEHIDAVAGRVRVLAHDESRLCWGAAKCPPPPEHVQRSDGFQLMVPTRFPEGDWTSVKVTFTVDSKLCEPPANQNTTRCGSGNPCLTPPCNGGYNTCGDPWDRTGHLFLVLDDCIDGTGSCMTNQNLELMRMITPFGTDAPPPAGRGIVPPRALTLDITPYAPLLTATRWVGAHIGHFTQAGWWVTTEFEFSKRPEEASPKPPADGVQVLFWGGANPPQASLSVPATATQVVTRLFTTGHGGNQACDGGANDGGSCDLGCPGGSCQNCDEFCHRTNEILVGGTPVWTAVPWRDDCSPGSVLACQGWNSCGWPSCVFSRAGWCPGYIACHHNAPCDQDLDMTTSLAPGGTYAVDYDVTPQNGSWSVSLVAYWYE